MKKSTKNKPPFFLDETPVDSDELKVHYNIAKTIESIINKTRGKKYKKKVIGLFGAWGSGKSTIVEILKKDMGKERVFVFDSWSHKGDFLKRAFLLDLAKFLKVDNEEYQEQDENGKLTVKDVLTRRVVKKYTEAQGNLEWFARFITYILLFSIVLIAVKKIIDLLVIPYVPNDVLPNSLIEAYRNYGWVVPIIILLLFLLSFFIKGFKDKLDSFINFYFLKKLDTIEQSSTKEDFEFSSYDFGRYLSQILSAAKGNKSWDEDRPFLVVFDNLDRVDDDTVLEVLSLIQLARESLISFQKKKSIANHIYFLVPIDKQRLEKTVEKIVVPADDSKESERYAKEFLEKVFPYKIDIPDIRHANWRKFFADMLKKSFGNLVGDLDITFIRRVFEKGILASKEKSLTPREIKNFINGLVENYLFWDIVNSQERIDIKMQAGYVALKTFCAKELQDYIEENENINIAQNESQDTLSKIQDILQEFYTKEEIKRALLRQYYRVNDISELFIEELFKAMIQGDIVTVKNVFKMFDDKQKVIHMIEEIIEGYDDVVENTDYMLEFINVLEATGYCKLKGQLRCPELGNKVKYLVEKNFSEPKYVISWSGKRVEIMNSLMENNPDLREKIVDSAVRIAVDITDKESSKENMKRRAVFLKAFSSIEDVEIIDLFLQRVKEVLETKDTQEAGLVVADILSIFDRRDNEAYYKDY